MIADKTNDGPPKKKIIIYGIGACGGRQLDDIRNKLANRYEVIGYMDSIYQKKYYQYQRVFGVNELEKVDYDYILINTYKQISDDEIYTLLCKHGIPKEKIVRYAKYAFYDPVFPLCYEENRMKVLQNLKNPPEFSGFLFGMSYADIGIDVNRLSQYIYNFAQGALDLFYRKLAIETALSVESKLKKIRFIMIELPYYIFNYDLSLCDGLFRYAINYISYWNDYHHFIKKEENREFLKGFSIFQDMFLKSNLGNVSMARNSRTRSNQMCMDTMKDTKVIPHTIKKYHRETVEENKKIFFEILQLIKTKLPETKIVILVWPQPSCVRKLYDEYPLQKEIFQEVMVLAKTEYPNMIIMDEQELFVGHDEYFADTYGHLNRCGCDIFTQYLDKRIWDITAEKMKNQIRRFP